MYVSCPCQKQSPSNKSQGLELTSDTHLHELLLQRTNPFQPSGAQLHHRPTHPTARHHTKNNKEKSEKTASNYARSFKCILCFLLVIFKHI